MFDFVLLICTIVILFFIAFLILFVNPGSKTNRYFFLWVIFLIIWIFSNYFENEFYFQNYRPLLLRVDFASAIFISAFFYLFCLNFPRIIPVSRQKKIIIYFPSIFLSILSFTNLIIKDIHFQDNTIVFAQGYLFLLYFLFFIFYMGSGCGELVLKYKKSTGIERTQIFYVVLGFSISAVIAVTLNLILPPLVFIPSNLARLGIYGILIFCIFTALAITRYHLFEIRVIATEILVGAVALILLVQALTAETLLWRILGFGLLSLFGIVGVFLIKSVLKEIAMRTELQRAYEELKKLDVAKTEFIAITSHQLRTPLTAIKGYVSMILEKFYGGVPEKIKKPLENVFISNERLIKLVNDILNISKIETGKMELKLEKASLEKIISDIVDELKIKAENKNLYLVFEKPKEPLPQILIDKDKIRQVILNVIDNAIKYTEKGGATIKCQILNDKCQVMVSDTGVGLTKEEMTKLFESFTRGRAGYQFWTEGAGLGLYISRKFLEMHQGKIWAESPGKGKGSTFFIELPIK